LAPGEGVEIDVEGQGEGSIFRPAPGQDIGWGEELEGGNKADGGQIKGYRGDEGPGDVAKTAERPGSVEGGGFM
jgi:hypothetical protein